MWLLVQANMFFSSGIYRNVRLVLKSQVHIDWYGTFVTTPDLAKNQEKSSSVNIKTEVCNSEEKVLTGC